MTDEERINWLEQHHTLHYTVEFLYIVDGYTTALCYDDDAILSARGDTLREALDRLIEKAS